LIRYIRLLKKNKKTLAQSRINDNPNPLGIQYDWIYRLYTVLNLPFEDKDNVDKYGYYYVDNMVREHVTAINNYLFELGILEYVTLDTENIQQLDEFNVRIVLKFKYLNLKFWSRFVVIFLPILTIVGLISLIIL
jgi:hypothetical protein